MAVDDFFPVFADWARKKGLKEAETKFRPILEASALAEYVAEYNRRVAQVDTEVPTVLAGPRDPWYPGPNEESDHHWPTLKKFFEDKLEWKPDRVATLDRASSKVVAYTPQPNTQVWNSKGLVVGYVQSGKTTNFTAVIAKAADVGYKLVIVLSGIHNGLRRQTQERLDQQLKELSPHSWLTLTDQNDDFYAPTTQSTALLHGHHDKVALCVVKKNVRVLKRLDQWLAPAAKARVLSDLPTLIIDDEADQASVETKAINPLIRQILAKLPRSTYIGYTATPFANVLIDPTGDDLYPKNFILNLPEPKGYFGTRRVFGRDAVEGEESSGTDLDGYDMIRRVDDAEIDLLRPVGKKAAVDFTPEITKSLTDALRWFWLATAARRARNDFGHSTMLVHTAVKISVHESYRDPILAVQDDIRRKLAAGNPELLDELGKQWASETGRIPANEIGGLTPVTFGDVLAQLPGVLEKSRLILDNCRSDDRLDYSEPGQIAIAVGGNTLSRGLTLEGLVVSFFVRAAQAYDTLLQMARWFGFRPGYEDLPRIWMTDQLCEWFRHLATVEHEIRLDIDRYEEQGLDPTEFGVRIRTHPVLRVTAKMGAARPAYSSYSGRRVQTRYFKANDVEWLRRNKDAADALVAAVRTEGAEQELVETGPVVYRDVSADLVLNFLKDYTSHEDSPDLDPELIAKYLRRQREQGFLDLWNVAVMAGDKKSETGVVRLGGVDFNRIIRSRLDDPGTDRADIKTLMSKDHRVVDFLDPREARKLSEVALMEARDKDPGQRYKGLLLLYPIQPLSEPDANNLKSRRALGAEDDVIGMAMVFPGSAEEKSKVPSTYISVDLSEVDIEVEPAELESLTGSGEDVA
ncbi:Z1 domain-containing protein [Rhodococcus pseudokoreensis]|uniref:Z1 domain-containing protein n=1 Tax=Rhodococcus pseudokoreensis TaxID=2811421 RepID=A0A974WBY8_9NOCA|nr:Z1 domain-containing protein [Rhodococcus pseudokoreensis]QSE93903.1 Z1 domain-containing protein [Rhodococcus pseudokoreensis]